MTTKNEIKIKKLLDDHVPGTVMLASWLEKKGISHDLQKHYRRNGWIESLGTGAFKRPKEIVTWKGGLYALQEQSKVPVHPGGLTALSLLGFSHYFRLGEEKIYLYSPLNTNLPVWFRNYSWGNPLEHVKTSILPEKIAFISHEEKNFTIEISSPERAILEYLYLSPSKLDLIEGYQVLTGLVNLQPKLIQELLEKCTSIKVKRLFLYMAERADHQWFKYIKRSSIELGKGDRSIIANGVYVASHRITLPKELTQI
jgi:hypothetical protein